MPKLSTLAEGSIIKINEGNLLVDFYVAKHDYESDLNGTGRTLLVRKDCYGLRAWHSSNVNAYASCSLDSWFNSTYKSFLDADVQKAIGTTKFYYTKGNGSYSVTTLSRAIFALSLAELGLKLDYANAEGSALPIAGTLKIANYKGAASDQWTRTPHTSYATNAIFVETDGGRSASVLTKERGARPAFTLPASLSIDANGEIIFVQAPDTVTVPDTPKKTIQMRVKAVDRQGAESVYATGAAVEIRYNLPPTISGSDGDLGSFVGSGPSHQYTVTDPNGDAVTIEEKLDGVTLHSYTAPSGSTNTLSFTADAWQKILNGAHTLTITATDDLGDSATRTMTFTKDVTTVDFMQTEAMAADDMPTKALVNIQGNFPTGCNLTVWICNNGNDAEPTWEDITNAALNGTKIFFANTTKTASAWGVKIKVQLSRGSATEACYITSIGGNFA